MKRSLSLQLVILLHLVVFAAALPQATPAAAGPDWRCTPTPPDAQGPFYRPGAPLRRSLGEGYLLTGRVLSARTCDPVADARIEIWMTGPDGRYADRWRATRFSTRSGRYRLQSPFPGPYGSRPPHIHIIVNAAGFRELVTQHYPRPGSEQGTFDLVLIPR